jgi:hypothetical protein
MTNSSKVLIYLYFLSLFLHCNITASLRKSRVEKNFGNFVPKGMCLDKKRQINKKTNIALFLLFPLASRLFVLCGFDKTRLMQLTFQSQFNK